MDERRDDELRALRERAYGPGADIHDDPVALARLDELERALTPVPAEPERPVIAAVDEPEAEHPLDENPADPEPASSIGPDVPDVLPAISASAPERSRPSRRLVWLWAGSVAAAAVIGAAVTTATLTWPGDRVAALAETDVSEWPSEFFGSPQEGSRVFEEYLGLKVLVVPNAWGSAEAGVECVFVLRVADDDSGGEQQSPGELLTTGCGEETYPPSAAFVISDASPAELRERFDVGTSIKVVLDQGEAVVFAR